MAPLSQLLQLQSLYQKKNHPFFTTVAQEADQHYHGHDYHDSTGDAEDIPVPDWTLDQLFGIVHTQDCVVCQSYMTHFVTANRSGEGSFKKALSARENQVTAAFSDGVQTGRQLQQERDSLRRACYVEERDKAAHGLDQQAEVLEATRKEMQALRDQVATLQITIDELSRKITEVAPDSYVGTPGCCEPPELSTSEDVDYVDTPSTNLSPFPDNDVPLNVLNSPAAVRKAEDASELAHSPLLNPAFAKDQEGNNLPNAHPTQSHTVPLAMIGEPATSPKPALSTLRPSSPLKPPAVQRPVISVPTPTSKRPREFKTLAMLQAAMKAAYAGDELSRARVRAFCTLAHGTPRDERTELHRYVLNHWRNTSQPIPSSSTQTTKLPLSISAPLVQTTFDGDTFSTEIYVDASQWGIGFVMDGLWLAWKFTDPEILSGTQIDSNWAEILAIEVGLWTVIHWVYYMMRDNSHSLEILVQCDNAGVVKAIEKRSTNHPLQQDILQRILDMVNEYDIELTVRWISSMDNIADKYSRGLPGRAADLLPFAPPLPSYLSDILEPSRTISDPVTISI